LPESEEPLKFEKSYRMIQIESIEIRHFRSIYKLRLQNISDFTVISGKNDVGKSNILKALNLFFNGMTDWNTRFSFDDDFSKEKLAESRKAKVRQFIRISIVFIRGNRYEKSLPDRFSVTKTWYRGTIIPEVTSDIKMSAKNKKIKTEYAHRAQASLQRYLNTVKFEYIPAVRDREFYGYMLSRLQDIVLSQGQSDTKLANAVSQLNLSVKSEVNSLMNEFRDVAGIDLDIKLPSELGQLFKAFGVSTKSGDHDLGIEFRGDGIRARFLPSLLHHISLSSKYSFIWGFEEPENNLEHAMSTKLASAIHDEYSNTVQVLLTSHSPAFFGHHGGKLKLFRVFSDKGRTSAVSASGTKSEQIVYKNLWQDVGLMEFQIKQQKELEAKIEDLEAEKTALSKTMASVKAGKSPIVFTEGKWDVEILKIAWQKLYDIEMPFRIFCCGTVEEDSGGADRLKKILEAYTEHFAPAIGVFDYDYEGKEQSFDMLKSTLFKKHGEMSKISKFGVSGAVILPIPPGRETYAEHLNLPLEFLFDDIYFVNSENVGLKLENRILITKTNTNRVISKTESTESYLREIVSASKKEFATIVVPKLPKKAFNNFIPLFELIRRLFDEIAELNL
jgi:predicted ATPase